ncbi:hypothetical protein [Streptomyces sp. NBC_01264]|uniref:hypothetical protein n=1 Tax=Streptomyces sp. NBC_01264 TaxID=2903804 RepID=UPI0022523291|nr:hypothetical protein [Streptomyces sp. NBC_01264]MCX4780048.1 hypothetical protein [Streptomyces sp. NBC_01264]
MAKTGPQKYPGASLTYWFQDAWPGNAMESNVGVLHTTEGRTVPDYRGGRDAPNFTLLPDIPARKLRVYQHYDFDVSSRALVNLAGGVETNTANAVQFELVGTCDERNAGSWDGERAGVDYIFWPDAPDWLLAELARIVRWAHDQHGIRLESTVTWKAYKKGQTGGSYGANGVRLSGAQWGAYYGWLGHQHVPENDHGDPGNINFARVLEYAHGETPDPSEEDDMPTAQEIAAAVWEHQLPNVRPDGSRDGTKKAAFWWLVWQDVFQAQLMTAISDAKMTPGEVRQALADGTLKVTVTVAPTTN